MAWFDRAARLIAAVAAIVGVLLIHGSAQAQCGSPPSCFGQSATIYVAAGIICGGPDNLTPYSGTLGGTSADDVMAGTDGVDLIDGLGSNDRICGLGGNDTLNGGAGDDMIDGGDGEDTIDAGTNSDLVLGGRGNDQINGGSGIDTLCGQNDDDTILGDLSSDLIDGSIGTDNLNGGVGTDTCLSGESLTDCEVTVGTIVECGTPLPTLTATPTVTPTNTPTPNYTGTNTPTPTDTATPTQTPTATPTNTPTATNTPTRTPGPCNVPAPNNPCIPGGGSSRTDCSVEWLATPVPLLKDGTPVPNVRKGIQKNRLYCYDGDPRCDYDGVMDNDSCTFRAALCINNNDPRFPKCAPSALTTFEVKKPRFDKLKDTADQDNLIVLETQFGPAPGFGLNVVRKKTVLHPGGPNTDEDFCSPNLDFVVPCRVTNSGSIRKGNRVIRFKETNVSRKVDTDSLKFECRPSTCGNSVIEDDHEQCDDGNRNNADGCNQACQIEPPSPTPTDTVPPTLTSTPTITPTDTPQPGDTNTPTNTPTITDTPTITETPTITPTAESTNTATVTPTGGAILMRIAPGGGSADNCRGTCVGGANIGQSCAINDECPGSTCSPASTCVGGSTPGISCTTNANCSGGGTCTPARTCTGGGYNGFACSAALNCNGCDPNRICRAAGNPLACCTGNQAGTCPLRGSCAIIQGTLPIRVPLNGVCLPRSYPPGDLACTTNAECHNCVGGANDGKACRLASQCPSGTCSSPGVCQLAQVGAEVGAQDGNGERPILLREDTLVLNPAYIPSLGTACVTAGGDGMGVIDCNGGRPNIDFTLKKDHNTTPGSPGNSGTANGLPDDAGCDDIFVAPDSTIQYTCIEGMMQCAGGVNAGEPCTTDPECPGSTCATCNIGLNGGPHTGVCNSPTVAESADTFVAGDAAVALPLAISLLDAVSVPPPADYGVDGLPCTPDDAAPPGNAVPVALSTGLNRVFVYDRANTNGLVLGPGFTCGAFPCAAQVTGQGISCTVIDMGSLDGLILGGGFPALDSPAGDIATTFQFELREIP